jgi:hypothetical protein
MRSDREQKGPPEFVPTFAIGHKFRFQNSNTAATALPITRAMLLNLYTMATTTTNQNRLITAIKLVKIQVWGQPPALGSAPTPSVVEWVGNHAPSTIHSDTPIGVNPSYVKTRAPADSNRWWSISGTDESEVLCKLSAPVGSTFDVSVTLRFADDEAAVSGENGTGAAATVGRVYWNFLDGFTSGKLIPVGGVTLLP